MCLAVPGKVVSINDSAPLFRTGRVSFGGLIREISLAYVPEVTLGDYVIVHAGIAISIIDALEAERVFDALDALGMMEEAGDEVPG